MLEGYGAEAAGGIDEASDQLEGCPHSTDE